MLTIIMAGGRGTRISELFPDIPKPLIPIEGVPVLEREIRSLARQGFKDIIITVSYMADKIMSYFGDGGFLGVKIEYFIEDMPLGNAGALFRLRSRIGNESFLLLNADAVFDVDFNRMVKFHRKHRALVTLFTHPNSHPYDSGLIITDKDGSVKKWLAKEDERPLYYKNRVNAGLHILEPKALDLVEDRVSLEEKVDLDRQILKLLCDTHRIFCYDSPEYVKDMGTPERYRCVARDFANGIVEGKNLMRKQKAVFLDRDGTINVYKGFLRDIEDFELITGIGEAVRLINESGYLCIVVTNQPVIARGELTQEELIKIHDKMETKLGKEGAYIDAVYYCPHHPDNGYAGEITSLKVECECRKPKPGMLFNAARDYNIDLSQSYMVGDSENDILAGNAAGCKSFLLGRDFNSVLDFVHLILGKTRSDTIMEQQSVRKYTPQYKAKVVMQALKGDKPLRDVAAENDLNPNVLSQWKCEFMKKSPSVFDNQKNFRHNGLDKPFVTDEYMRKIRELRLEKNMSQEQVAQYLGTSQTMYARYENGMSKLPIRHLLMLVQLYGVSADYILGISAEK